MTLKPLKITQTKQFCNRAMLFYKIYHLNSRGIVVTYILVRRNGKRKEEIKSVQLRHNMWCMLGTAHHATWRDFKMFSLIAQRNHEVYNLVAMRDAQGTTWVVLWQLPKKVEMHAYKYRNPKTFSSINAIWEC